ncbi:MAG: glycosyltransferase family A protein [Alphaproteobacteria bacterium]
MNDLLKLLSSSLKPFGYHVRKYNAPNILRIPELEKKDTTLTALRASATRNRNFTDSNLDKMVIFVRTCIRVNRNVNQAPRVTGAPLSENTYRCLRSLVTSVNNALQSMTAKDIEVINLDDRSDAEFITQIKSVWEKLDCKWTVRQTREPGQGPSLHEQFMMGRSENAIVYFCEDDYLHEPDAIEVCWRFYEDMAKKLGTNIMIYPQERIVLYEDHHPSYIVTGPDRHWRTIRNATHTFITHGHVVRDHWLYFENTKFVGVKKYRKKGSEARTTNKLFRTVPGFSPMRPAAVHLQFENTLPPLYDWRPLWDKNAA